MTRGDLSSMSSKLREIWDSVAQEEARLSDSVLQVVLKAEEEGATPNVGDVESVGRHAVLAKKARQLCHRAYDAIDGILEVLEKSDQEFNGALSALVPKEEPSGRAKAR